jgi:hypothetical protein
MSQSGVCLVHEVIPFIDGLTRAMDDVRDDETKHPAVRVAAANGLDVLNKYYSKTDDSHIYRIAMSKSPSQF